MSMNVMSCTGAFVRPITRPAAGISRQDASYLLIPDALTDGRLAKNSRRMRTTASASAATATVTEASFSHIVFTMNPLGGNVEAHRSANAKAHGLSLRRTGRPDVSY